MKPPLALSVAAIAADGSQTTWWSGDRFALNRPQQLGFRTRIGEGFSDAGCTLARRIDRDYNDVELYNDVVFVGDDGQIAYEGRIGATPRSTQGGHSIAVQCTGWMAHAKDQKFREIYVDRDLAAWQGPSLGRQVTVSSGGADVDNPTVVTDTTSNLQAIKLAFTGAWSRQHQSEAWYDAGPDLTVAHVYYSLLQNAAVNLSDAQWSVNFVSAVTDGGGSPSFVNETGDLIPGTGAFSANNTYEDMAAPRRYVLWQLLYPVAAGSAGTEYAVFNRSPAVYGSHGLSGHGSDPVGYYASDVIEDIARRWCPELNTVGVQDTSLVIPHIVFKERTTPFDAFLLLNGPHGYELAVWENKTLTFRPYDLSDYDWQVRMDQPGVDLSLQGDTTEGLANYAVVEFDNVATGMRDQVSPSDDPSLQDTTVDHPANKHGLSVELTVGLTFPTTKEVAIAFGQSYLNEFNRPKNRGQITVTGHILDRAGHWIQPWMVRAGQTISVVDHPNDSPRLITETSYDHQSRTVTISTDSGELNMVEAVVDYIRTSLQAGGLG